MGKRFALDHVTIPCGNLPVAEEFYVAFLAST
jgi:catechol 2,3-dioxygenase-like lactoylglutathione lyase family enzyme